MSFLDGPIDAARGFAGDVRDFGGDVVDTMRRFWLRRC